MALLLGSPVMHLGTLIGKNLMAVHRDLRLMHSEILINKILMAVRQGLRGMLLVIQIFSARMGARPGVIETPSATQTAISELPSPVRNTCRKKGKACWIVPLGALQFVS